MSTILIVDDEKPIRDLLMMLCGDAGYRAVVATHGGQALDLVAQELPDLVVSDVMMPVLSGIELCRRLKQHAATSQIPIILMSAAGRDIALGAGADAFIDKPFDITVLESLMARWLGQSGSG